MHYIYIYIYIFFLSHSMNLHTHNMCIQKDNHSRFLWWPANQLLAGGWCTYVYVYIYDLLHKVLHKSEKGASFFNCWLSLPDKAQRALTVNGSDVNHACIFWYTITYIVCRKSFTKQTPKIRDQSVQYILNHTKSY